MGYDFNTVFDRKHTNSLKWDFAAERGKPADVLPLWVADMDFRTPESVMQALHQAVDHGIFGYSESKEEYFDAVSSWFFRRFGWLPKQDWLVKTPGIVYALAMAVQALTEPGESVLIQPPVYYPFFSVVQDNGRRVVENRLIYKEGRYSIDFSDFEKKIAEEKVKLFLLCSPHNPICRVWTEEELKKMAAICQKYGVYVVSDEIHCDFAFPGHPHIPFLLAVPELQEQTILCTAPSKSFNIAGFQVSNIWIPGIETREKFQKAIDRSGYSQLNGLGLVACQAAYEGGEEWLEDCKAYMRENLQFVRTFLAEKLSQIKLVEPEGTYFAWLDCSGLGLSDEELNDRVLHRAKLWLDAGAIFGGDAGQFQRMVLACPRKTLEEAMERLTHILG